MLERLSSGSIHVPFFVISKTTSELSRISVLQHQFPRLKRTLSSFSRLSHRYGQINGQPLASYRTSAKPQFTPTRLYSEPSNQHESSKRKETTIPKLELEKDRKFRYGPITWTSAIVSLGLGGFLLAYMFYLRRQKEETIEKKRRRVIGKSLIGGPWELVNMFGKQESNKDYEGQWLLIYFGFTHCPDICPDEIEKMCKTADLLNNDPQAPAPARPIFFSVDPHRDTPEAVKKYCEEFSSKLMGFTGSKEQVEKVSRTFRVYHSEGPRDEFDDYIVDHTVIIYLIDPTGQFLDYYGQNRSAEQIADAVKLQMLKFYQGQKKGWW